MTFLETRQKQALAPCDLRTCPPRPPTAVCVLPGRTSASPRVQKAQGPATTSGKDLDRALQYCKKGGHPLVELCSVCGARASSCQASKHGVCERQQPLPDSNSKQLQAKQTFIQGTWTRCWHIAWDYADHCRPLPKGINSTAQAKPWGLQHGPDFYQVHFCAKLKKD